MTTGLLSTVVAVAALLAIALWLIQRYPLRMIHRRVFCPIRQVPAQVNFIRNEHGYGNLALTDVAACSLLGEKVDCGKECLKEV